MHFDEVRPALLVERASSSFTRMTAGSVPMAGLPRLHEVNPIRCEESFCKRWSPKTYAAIVHKNLKGQRMIVFCIVKQLADNAEVITIDRRVGVLYIKTDALPRYS